MDRYKDILSGVQDELTSARKTHDDKKHADLTTKSSKKPIDINADQDSYNPPVNKTSILNNNDDEIPNPIDEDVMEGKCRSDEDNESYSMIINSLKNIISNVNAILNNSNLDSVKENLTEPWVFGMIAVVDENVSKVHDFVKFNEPNDEVEEDDESDAGTKPGLWDNIRKKKEREGKNYRPAKPGDKDRPNPDMWKKLTK